MSPTIYVVKVRNYPEYPVDTMAGESIESVGRTYMVMRSIPPERLDDLMIYDCYTATMYQFK